MTRVWRNVTPSELVGEDQSGLVIGPFGSSLRTSDFVAEGVPLVFVRDIRAADFSTPRAYVTSEKAQELRAHVALPGDVLVTKMGDPPGHACIYTGEVPAVITADCIRLRPSHHFDAGFIVHALRTPKARHKIAAITTGAAQQKVSLERFRSRVQLPAPTFDEQRRIATILDQADALRATRRQVLAHLDDLTRSIFHRLFADGGAGYPEVALGEVAEFFGGASLSEGEPFVGQRSGTLLMKVSDMNAIGNEVEVVATAQWTSGQVQRSTVVESGAVVLPKRGASIATNKKRVTVRTTALDPNLMGIQPDLGRIKTAYLFAWFQSFDLSTITSGSTIPQLNKRDLEPLMIPLPSLARQREFETCIRRVRAQRAVAVSALKELGELFDSLQVRAFRGYL